MGTIPVGLQLYCVRADCARDLPGTLAAVAKMGYDGVEFAGYHGYSAADLRRMLDDTGLKCCGTHLRLDALQGDELQRTIEFNRVLGNRFLIVAWLEHDHDTPRSRWLEYAQAFAEAAARAAEQGFVVGYHNHFDEFKVVEGETPWDTFFGNTDPRVIMQMDTGNCLHGGGDPVAILKQYPGRAVTVHLKEWDGSWNRKIIGEGVTNWPELFAACESAGATEWYIVEQENENLAPLECVRRCRENLRKMGK